MSATLAPTRTPSAVIDRISLVLDAFDGPGRLTLAQIVRRTGLPRSSAHRMLERLVQLRWLRRSGRDYELGMRLVELGSLAVHQDRLVRAATPLLGELHRATGLLVHLAVLDGSDVVYLEKIGRPADLRDPHPGRRSSARTLYCRRQGDPGLLRRGRRGGSAGPQDQVLDRDQLPTGCRIGQGTCPRCRIRARGVAARVRLRCSPYREPWRGRRRGVGVRSDESHDVRSAAGRAGTDDRDGHLAQRRRRPAAGRADAAAPAALAPCPASRPAVRVSLDPQIAALIEELDAGFPPVHTMTGAQARAVIRSRFVPAAEPEPVAEVRDARFRGQAATSRCGFTGQMATNDLPILVYGHGGGFVFCDLDSHDGLCREIANRIPAVVVSVAYRLAPENRWPAAADDFYAATAVGGAQRHELGRRPRPDRRRRRQRRRQPGRRDRADGPGPRRPALAAQLLLYP